MKIKAKKRKLKGRQKDYDDMVQKRPELANSHYRPGSVKSGRRG